jgi:single-stranded DNA-binding protein
VAGNRIELWGKVLGEPELRTTPAGTSVLRILAQAGEDPELALVVTMTGEATRRVAGVLKPGIDVTVKGSVKAVRRRLNSGIVQTSFEVVADSIELKGLD